MKLETKKGKGEIQIFIRDLRGEKREEHYFSGSEGTLIIPVPDLEKENLTLELHGDIVEGKLNGVSIHEHKRVKIKGGEERKR